MITHLDVYGHAVITGKHSGMAVRCGCGWTYQFLLSGDAAGDTLALAQRAMDHETLPLFDVHELLTNPAGMKATLCELVLRLADDETLRTAVIGSMDYHDAAATAEWGERELVREPWRGHPRAADVEHCIAVLVASAMDIVAAESIAI